MAKISAFVGHSFLPEDEAVVRKFTDFFDQIAKSHDFDWVHATEPRPDDVASKVLDLIEGRNLFIGICTPNERVAKANHFTSVLLGNQLKIQKEDLQSKTSDWIIQEIGLAIGRRMKIIILLQGDVRKPGSLQGNIEYISFDRNAIEKSFSNILAMITSLQGSSVSAVRASETSSVSTASGEDHEEELDHNIEEPNESWDELKFDFEYFKAVILKEPERAKVISEAWLGRVGSDPEASAIWEASCLLIKTQHTNENHLSVLVSIADKYPKNVKIQKSLARAYEHFEDYERARERLQVSLVDSKDNAEKRGTLTALATVCQKLGDTNGVESAVSEMSALIESSNDEKDFLSTLEELAAWHCDNKMLKLAMKERELEIDPSDTQKRFQLAYAHSQNDNNSLTMYHYEKIPRAQRDPATWNNLGAIYQTFSLPGMSVSALQTAAKEGETLAMSNLAEKLISAGFLKEAQMELLCAKDINNAHKNVAKAQVRLDSIPSEEEENKAMKLEGASELSQFLSEVGHCTWQPMPSELGGTWIDEEVSLVVSKEKDRFTAKGSYQKNQTVNALAAAIAGTSEKSVDTFDVTVSGRLIGSVLVGEYTTERRRNPLKPMTLLDAFPKKKDFIAVCDPERHKLRCLVDKELREFEVTD